MELKSVTLKLPEKLYSKLQKAAQARRRSVEEILQEEIDISHGDLTAVDIELLITELETYSDPQLWAVVHRGLSQDEALQYHELSAKNKRGELTQVDKVELDQLLDLTDRHILLRSKALLLLKKRGHDIDTFLKMRS
jgi:hypothetical protein